MIDFVDVMTDFGVSEIVARTYAALDLIAGDDADNGNPILWFVDAMVGQAEDLENLVRDRNGRSGWANTVDPALTPDGALPWLGQFVGVTVDQHSRVTARDQVIRHQSFGRGSIPGIVEYIQTFLVGPKRVGILERSTVSGGVISDGHPWRYTVVVRNPDLGAPTYAELAAADPFYNLLALAIPLYSGLGSVIPNIQAAVQASKPGGDLAYTLAVAGLIYYDFYPGFHDLAPFATYTALDGSYLTYGAMDDAFGEYAEMAHPFASYAQLDAAFATYAAMAAYDPP